MGKAAFGPPALDKKTQNSEVHLSSFRILFAQPLRSVVLES